MGKRRSDGRRDEGDGWSHRVSHEHKNGKVLLVVFTQHADGVLALLHLFGHHPADGHKTLCDVAAGFH